MFDNVNYKAFQSVVPWHRHRLMSNPELCRYVGIAYPCECVVPTAKKLDSEYNKLYIMIEVGRVCFCTTTCLNGPSRGKRIYRRKEVLFEMNSTYPLRTKRSSWDGWNQLPVKLDTAEFRIILGVADSVSDHQDPVTG